MHTEENDKRKSLHFHNKEEKSKKLILTLRSHIFFNHCVYHLDADTVRLQNHLAIFAKNFMSLERHLEKIRSEI